MYSMYDQVKLTETGDVVGTGWLPPLPDSRDFTEEIPQVAELAEKLGVRPGASPSLPAAVDFSNYCSPVENQLNLGSCTAQAAAGVVEYYQRRAFGRHIDASRLFIYKTTRNLMRVTGDTGAWLRNTMGALVLCGVPPEKYWPYVVADFDKEPGAFVYSLADNYEALLYFCHDPIGRRVTRETVLSRVKTYIAAGVPSMFGFFGFDSFGKADVKGGIPFPCPGERARWGHAIVAVGYDDNMEITNTSCRKKTKGALLIRNSWGSSWGDKGYGWLPYDYVLSGYARDFWSMLSMEWVETGQFGI